jgi:hypothetical protein
MFCVVCSAWEFGAWSRRGLVELGGAEQPGVRSEEAFPVDLAHGRGVLVRRTRAELVDVLEELIAGAAAEDLRP